MPAGSANTSAATIRGRLVDTLRRDLIGPGPVALAVLVIGIGMIELLALII
jgi:hypothetical protein